MMQGRVSKYALLQLAFGESTAPLPANAASRVTVYVPTGEFTIALKHLSRLFSVE